MEKGEHLEGTILRTTQFGAIVEIDEPVDAMVHSSQIPGCHGWDVLPEDILHTGDVKIVRVLDIHDSGRVSLSLMLDEERETT